MTEHNADTKLNHVYLVDGSSFIFRSFHALPVLTRSDGTPVNAVLGFTNMLMKLLYEVDADHLAIVFDSARETFRNDLYPDYKANRPDPPEELIPQFPLVRDATLAFNVVCLETPGYEADDLIATYTRQAVEQGADVTIVSSDKDLMQLVSDRVRMFDAIKNRYIGPEQVKEKFGVGPDKVTEVQALAGDSTDNVPGVPGIGPKTAAQLITEYGDLETLLTRASEIKQAKRRESLLNHAEAARLSHKLVQLRDDVPVDIPIESLVRKDPDPDTLIQFLSTQGFKSIMARMQSRLGAAGASAPEWSSEFPPPTLPPTETKYELVQTVSALQDWITRAHQAGFVAVDTETTSLDQSRAELVGISMSVQPGHACYIPLGHKEPEEQKGFDFNDLPDQSYDMAKARRITQIPMDEALKLLGPLLADSSVLKVGHNIKYDMVVLSRYDVSVLTVDDTMLLSYVLENGSHGRGMEELAKLHLGHETIKYKDVTGSEKSQVTFDQVPLEKALAYAAEDADVTLRLHHLLKPRLIQERMTTVYETVERPLISVLAAMEDEGIKVDSAQLQRLSEDFTQRMAVLEKEIHKLAGHPFNVGSPKQLGEVLFEKMGLEGGRKGKAGTYGTGADVLETLAVQGHQLPARVIEWRQLDKLKSTYTDALVTQINPQTGRVHTSFAMAAASTG